MFSKREDLNFSMLLDIRHWYVEKLWRTAKGLLKFFKHVWLQRNWVEFTFFIQIKTWSFWHWNVEHESDLSSESSDKLVVSQLLVQIVANQLKKFLILVINLECYLSEVNLELRVLVKIQFQKVKVWKQHIKRFLSHNLSTLCALKWRKANFCWKDNKCLSSFKV